LDGGEKGVQGYICTPHEKESVALLNYWKNSDNISVIYFVTATFSGETTPYFPNKANHYILASFRETHTALEDIRKQNYLSIYFTKYTYGDIEIGDLANVIAKRERVRKASLADIQVITTEEPKFTFPYFKNAVVLEVKSEKTHQSDQKYCERTRRDVVRKGISLNNLVSFSILDKLK
jgi:hypothetical protein